MNPRLIAISGPATGQTFLLRGERFTVGRHADNDLQLASLEELLVPPGNRLEALIGDRAGQWSIRINDQYRICFVWSETGPFEVEIVDYH